MSAWGHRPGSEFGFAPAGDRIHAGDRQLLNAIDCAWKSRRAATFEQLAQARGLIPVQSTRRHVEHQSFPLFAVRFRFDPVQAQENDRSHHGGAFVSIEEGMIATNVKEIRRRNFDNIGIRRPPAEARLRSQHGGREQIFVADTV